MNPIPPRGRSRFCVGVLASLALLALCTGASAQEARALALHPDNPHYFLFRGKPAVLVGSTEHYGAVLNGDFDFVPYLAELQSKGLNLTRTFSGVYREVPGSFNIKDNTLAPKPDKYVSPWARAGDGKKYDLSKWNDDYFARLKAFMSEAGKRGVVVELVLFCTFYEDVLWDICPLNTKNNVNGVGKVGREQACTLKEQALVDAELAFARKVVAELKDFDNVYYEVCNEPYFAGVADDWQRLVSKTVAAAEKDFPAEKRHLIARNIANGSAKVDNPDPNVSIFNFHYANPPEAVKQNWELNKPIGYDETGFRGTGDAVYRIHGWEFLMAGGAVYDHLDYSFTPDAEGGTAEVTPPTPGGGGATLRGQFKIMKSFVDGFDLVRMKPDNAVVKSADGGAKVRALSEAGRQYAVYVNRMVEDSGSKSYAGTFLDPHSGQPTKLVLNLPTGKYRAEWLDPRSGRTTSEAVSGDAGGGGVTVTTPAYEQDVALRLVPQKGR
jgi:hypothetical protein